MFRTARSIIAGASIAAALAFPPAAVADALPLSAGDVPCTEAHDTTGSSFDVRLCSAASDVDQLRSGLQSAGMAYSGPAALFNVLNGMWLRQGMPVFLGAITIGIAQPEIAPFYANTTAYLQRIADVSGLGESLAKHRTAFAAATAYAGASGWKLAAGSVDTLTTAEFGLALAQRLHVAPVQMVFAHYEDTGSSYERQMGHMVSVVSAQGSIGTGEVKLTLYDSAKTPDGANQFETQSAPRLEHVTLKRVTIAVKIGDSVQSRVRWELTGDHYASADHVRHMVEGFNWFSALKA